MINYTKIKFIIWLVLVFSNISGTFASWSIFENYTGWTFKPNNVIFFDDIDFSNINYSWSLLWSGETLQDNYLKDIRDLNYQNFLLQIITNFFILSFIFYLFYQRVLWKN